jgi:ornithine carbamoyltransferase
MKLKGRHFLSLQDLDSDEILQILRHAIDFKKRKKTQKPFKNKSLAMIFQKPSTRTSITAM